MHRWSFLAVADMSCADDAWVSFGRREGFGLDWVQLPCEEAQPACKGGGSGGHLLFCWGHYGSPLSRCWSVLAAHRCSSTPADKCHVSRWFQRCWLGLLEGQVDNSDVYIRTAPQSLAPAGMVMPSGNEWIGGSHHLYHMPRSDPTLAPEENGKKLLWFTEFDIFGAMTEPVRCLGQFLGWCHRLINMHAKQFVTSTQE